MYVAGTLVSCRLKNLCLHGVQNKVVKYHVAMVYPPKEGYQQSFPKRQVLCMPLLP